MFRVEVLAVNPLATMLHLRNIDLALVSLPSEEQISTGVTVTVGDEITLQPHEERLARG